MGHSPFHTPVHTVDKNKHSQCHVVLRVMINSTIGGGHWNICRITSHSKILTKKTQVPKWCVNIKQFLLRPSAGDNSE